MQNTGFNKSASYLENVFTIKRYFGRGEDTAFLFAVSDSFHLRKQVNEEVLEYCTERGKTVGVVELIWESDTGFLTQLRQAKKNYPGGIILSNLDALIRITEGEFVSDFNMMREGLINISTPFLIWLSSENHILFTRKAFDLYLRRDLSTLFFEDPGIVADPVFKERFTESARTSADFEETSMRIALYEQQLAEARHDVFSRSRLANEIVLPLIKAYVDNSMLIQAKKLLAEFETDFDYKRTNADTIIGGLFEKTGDLDVAIKHYEKALDKNVSRYGEDNFVVADCYSTLGTAYQEKGNIDDAIEYLEKALNVDLKFFGGESAEVAVCYNNLGSAWHRKGDLNKAIEYYERALRIGLSLLGAESDSVAIYYNNLGSGWLDKGNLDKALEYYEKSLNIGLKLSGESHNVAVLYNNLGFVWNGKGNLDKAIEYHENALKIESKLSSEESQNIAILYNNIGSAWQDKGNLDKALEYYEKSLNIRLKLSGENSLNVAINYNNIGELWRKKGNLDKALEYYEKSLNIGLKLSGENSQNVAISYNNIGKLWKEKGNLNKALEYLEKAYHVFLKLSGDDNPYTIIAKQNYENCLRKKIAT